MCDCASLLKTFFIKCTFFQMQNYVIEKSLKIFIRKLKKFCNTFYNDFSTLFVEYPSLINILMPVIIVMQKLYV